MLARLTLRRCGAVITFGLLATGVATAQEAHPDGAATLEMLAFTPRPPTDEILKARKGNRTRTEAELLKFEWNRPANVKYILIAGCGGGAGGGNGGTVRVPQPLGGGHVNAPVPGKGGKAALYETQWIGPLAAARYTITLGSGGLGGEAGSATIFTGTDMTLQFSGARKAGPKEPPQPFAGVFKAEPGEAAVMGLGPNVSAGGRPGPNHSAGDGGDASPFGAGGAGGADSRLGEDAGGLCAGGGGAGSPRHRPSTLGGRGGDGYLQVVPLVDASVVAEQVERLIHDLTVIAPPPQGAE